MLLRYDGILGLGIPANNTFQQNWKYGDGKDIMSKPYNRANRKKKPRPAGFNNWMHGSSRELNSKVIHTHMPNKDKYSTTPQVGPGSYKHTAGMGRQVKSQHRAASRVRFGTEHRFQNNFGWTKGTNSVGRIWMKDQSLLEQWATRTAPAPYR